MKKINKILILFLVCFSFVFPQISKAQEKEEFFKAKVKEILQERIYTSPEDGAEFLQQNILLEGMSRGWKGKEVVFEGVNELEVIGSQKYKVGDKVYVVNIVDEENNINEIYINGFVRTNSLWWLLIIFLVMVVLVTGWKGVRALISLVASFAIVMQFIIPQILQGKNPIWVTIIGSLFILFFVVYITEGINKKSHLAIITMFISLFIVGLLSYVFVQIAKLSGTSTEEVLFLVGYGKSFIDFRGLLLAGIMIGTLGVLDDVVISQIASVDEIYKTDKNLNKKQVYKKAMNIGVSHMSSMINTLFLVYTGASFTLLLLFKINSDKILGFSQILSEEHIATEIVRTLAGSIGLLISVPIATLLAVMYLIKNNKK
jgi:uncharacterized membrane protein